MTRHPMSVAWDQFKSDFPTLGQGPIDGFYLWNRLQVAFDAGWSACEEQAVSSGRARPVARKAAKPSPRRKG
jgi:hypothetical protein